ncbi:CBS domain-containing protein [Curtobacterium luteum]|uniref:CBS domain-containing protein n=2 Tax=Curtobacterium luteum TaxID=33881 RepID=A0A8H9GBF7_9MICO|nr:CBS domain-containing protein [Curtobacterium luteum]GGL06600.1 hypothetical protein GCM10009769_26100 [Curtobacterium luteum]
MVGAAFGEVAATVDPALHGQVGAFAVVGMGAVFAGSTRAPITAGIMLFELTGDHALVLPVVVAVVIATAVSKVLARDTVYTLKLSRRGVDLTDSALAVRRSSGRTAGGAARPLGPVVSRAASAADALAALESGGGAPVVVLDADGHFAGVVSARSAGDAVLTDVEFAARPVTDVLSDVVPVRSDAGLDTVVQDVVDASDTAGLPVVDEDGRPVGWLGQADALRALVLAR